MDKVKQLLLKVWNNQTLRRYVHSSVVTFLAFFLPFLLIELKKMGAEGFEQAGLVGLGGVVSRLVIKAIYETLLTLLTKKG